LDQEAEMDVLFKLHALTSLLLEIGFNVVSLFFLYLLGCAARGFVSGPLGTKTWDRAYADPHTFHRRTLYELQQLQKDLEWRLMEKASPLLPNDHQVYMALSLAIDERRRYPHRRPSA
jgi:hypothetical protein